MVVVVVVVLLFVLGYFFYVNTNGELLRLLVIACYILRLFELN